MNIQSTNVAKLPEILFKNQDFRIDDVCERWHYGSFLSSCSVKEINETTD